MCDNCQSVTETNSGEQYIAEETVLRSGWTKKDLGYMYFLYCPKCSEKMMKHKNNGK